MQGHIEKSGKMSGSVVICLCFAVSGEKACSIWRFPAAFGVPLIDYFRCASIFSASSVRYSQRSVFSSNCASRRSFSAKTSCNLT